MHGAIILVHGQHDGIAAFIVGALGFASKRQQEKSSGQQHGGVKRRTVKAGQ
ncbi:MAG: hypothetical protein IPM82_21645 [Saprospiraceae bacterium]|nr:hypothetical protein [Saprospiraceae bacterium]